MSTNISIDVTLQRLQKVSKDTREVNRTDKKDREDDLALQGQADALSGNREQSSVSLDGVVESLGQPLDRTGQTPAERQKAKDGMRSSVPDTYKELDVGAGYIPQGGFCHCYFYDQLEVNNNEYSKVIKVYSADGSSSAEARVPISIGLSIDLDIRPEEYFVQTGEVSAPTQPGTFEVTADQGTTAGVCALNNPVVPPFDPIPPGSLNLQPAVDIFTGSSTSFLDIKQFNAPASSESVGGYISLPISRDVFALIYTNKSATCTSQLVRYEIFNSAVTGFEAFEEIKELFCVDEGYPTTVPLQTFLEGRTYGVYNVEASSQYIENTASASEVRGGTVCFLVTPTSVKQIPVSPALESAVGRIFTPPPAPSVTVSFGPINNFNSTVELIADFDPSYRQQTLGFFHDTASALYSYNLSGDINIGGTTAAYYYLNDYNGGIGNGANVKERFPDAEYGANSDNIYSAQLVDLGGSYKLEWTKTKISDPTAEPKALNRTELGLSASLIFTPPANQAGFPRVAAASYAGKKSYCLSQSKALGISLQEDP